MRRFSDDEIEKLRFMASFGHDGKSIARALDRTPQSVRVKAVEIGVRLRHPNMHHRRIRLSAQAWRNGRKPACMSLCTRPIISNGGG
jgi:hypothetical protein